MDSEKKLTDLPPELNINILKNTRLKDLLNMTKTNPYFRVLLDENFKSILLDILNNKGVDQQDYDAVIESNNTALIYYTLKFLVDSDIDLQNYSLYKLLDVPSTFTEKQKAKWLEVVYKLIVKKGDLQVDDERGDDLHLIVNEFFSNLSHNDIIAFIYHIYKLYSSPENKDQLQYMRTFINVDLVESIVDSLGVEYVFGQDRDDTMYEYSTWENMPKQLQEMYAYVIYSELKSGELGYVNVEYNGYEFVNNVIEKALEKNKDLAEIFVKYFPKDVSEIANAIQDKIDSDVNKLYTARDTLKRHDLWNKEIDLSFNKKIEEIRIIPDFIKPYIKEESDEESNEDSEQDSESDLSDMESDLSDMESDEESNEDSEQDSEEDN